MPIRRTVREAAEHRRRSRKRLETAITALGCRNMSDTKWREVFHIFRDLSLQLTKAAKFVDGPRIWPMGHVYILHPKGAEWDHGAFEFREIEWLEIRGAGAARAKELLDALGRLPIVPIDEGFRIQAYGNSANH